MKKNSIRLIGLTVTYLIFILSIVCSSVMKNKENISDKSKIAFLSAIDKETKNFITQITFEYDSKYSPNSVSADDKMDWVYQFFLIMEDSCRHRLDSIFREEVKRQGFNLNTSISYTYNGKTISRGELKSLKGVRVIHEKIYRKDNKKENDITLKAYVYLPFNILIGNTTLYILLLLNIVGVAAYIYRRKTKMPKHCLIETETRTTDNAKWIIIDDDSAESVPCVAL